MQGRNRHVLVDSLGMVLDVVLTRANVSDVRGGGQVLRQALQHYPRLLTQIWADQGYKGLFPALVWNFLGLTLQLTSQRGFGMSGSLRPKRWVVERTFAWLGQYRRLSKDYEYLIETSQAMIHLAMTRLMLRRLVRGTS